VDAAEKLLKTDGNLVFTDPYRRDGLSRKILTSEQDFTIKAQLEPAPEAKVPTGFPLVWLERDPRDFRPPVMLQTVTPPEGTRQVVQIGAEPALGQLTARLNSPYLRQAEEQPPKVPRIDQTGLRLRGLYRGQQIDRLVPVDLIPVPLVTYAEPPITLTAGVAVRGPKGYGEGNGAVTVILDCSGSMGPPEGQRPTPETKFVQATAALREILTRLPGGTMVNVWVYGQAMGREKTVKDVERTVKPLFPQPVAWNPDDASQLEGLMAKVAALEPWNETPAVHAILKAREEMLALNPPGYKTILVLTDGMDNRFGKPDPMTPRNQQIRKALREAFTMKEGISLNIVGFRISPDGQETDEERNAREQFEVVENLSPPGRFWSVKTQDQLIAALDQALRQKLRARLDSEDNIPDRRLQEGVDVTPLGSNPNWRLGVPPGGYRLWATFGPQRPERRLALSPGDLMLVNLVPGQGRGLEFERALYGLEPVNQTKPAKANDRGDWRLTVLQNQAPSGGPGLQALLALEKTYDRSETSLEQLKPRRLWLELATPQDVRTPFVQRWSFRPGYPAPAWGIDVPAWPVQAATQAPAAPVLRAWWNPDLEPAPAATLERGADFRSTVDLVSRPIPIGPATAYLESVTAETRNVETAPGTWAMQPCLVVRLTYPKDQPLLVRPGNLAVQGREHRLYRDVNKVTALFWPVAAADVDNKLAALQFYDLAAFQAEAKARGYWLELGNLRPPDAGDNPPPRLPVPELSSRPERRGGP
jgi:hypothetical protein